MFLMQRVARGCKMSLPVIVFLVLVGVAVLFQIALALGAPWGEYTLGGRYSGALPNRLRPAALAQALVLCLFAVIASARAGLILPDAQAISRIAIWLVAGFFVLGSLANLATPSRRERMVWAPVNILLLILSILIALAP
jgi:hypothetical protein